MRARNLAGRTALLVALLAPVAAVAQGGAGAGTGGGRMGGPGGAGGRMFDQSLFDPKTVTTIQGEIVAIDRFERGRGRAGVHLTVATGSETLPVHLGPGFYLDQQSVKLAKGDKVEVKGSKVTLGGEPTIIAQEVRRGGEVLALRDASGVPLWRGQGRAGGGSRQ